MTITITHRIGPYYHEDGDLQIIEAHENGQLISELYADLATGQIMQIETIPSRRREGIATALLDYAGAHGIELFHSPVEHCTPEGLAFAERQGLDDPVERLVFNRYLSDPTTTPPEETLTEVCVPLA